MKFPGVELFALSLEFPGTPSLLAKLLSKGRYHQKGTHYKKISSLKELGGIVIIRVG